jgi:hypothetical protein
MTIVIVSSAEFSVIVRGESKAGRRIAAALHPSVKM